MKATLAIVLVFAVAACSAHPVKVKAKLGALALGKLVATKIGAAKIGAIKFGAAKVGGAIKAKQQLLVKGADTVLSAKQHFVAHQIPHFVLAQTNKINSALQWKKDLITGPTVHIVEPEIALVHSPPPVLVDAVHVVPHTSYGPPPPPSPALTYGAPLSPAGLHY